MPWSQQPRDRGLFIWKTTLTMPSDASNVVTPPLTGIKLDRPFTVLGNLQETSLNSDADANLLGALTEDGNYASLSADVFTTLTGAIQANTLDPDTVGKVPYFKIEVEPDGTMGGADVEFAVLQDDDSLQAQ